MDNDFFETFVLSEDAFSRNGEEPSNSYDCVGLYQIRFGHIASYSMFAEELTKEEVLKLCDGKLPQVYFDKSTYPTIALEVTLQPKLIFNMKEVQSVKLLMFKEVFLKKFKGYFDFI